MATFVKHNLRVFNSSEDPSSLPSNLSGIFRLKSYESATDPRAWGINHFDRKQYILDVFGSEHSSQKRTFDGQYVKAQALLETLLSNKNADIEHLSNQLLITDQFLEELGITNEQRELLNRKRMQETLPSVQTTDQVTPKPSSVYTCRAEISQNVRFYLEENQGLIEFPQKAKRLSTDLTRCSTNCVEYSKSTLRYEENIKYNCEAKKRSLRLHSYHESFAIPSGRRRKMRSTYSQTGKSFLIDDIMADGSDVPVLSALFDEIQKHDEYVDVRKLRRRGLMDKSMQHIQDVYKNICAQTSQQLFIHPKMLQLRNECDIRQLECDRYKLHIGELTIMNQGFGRLKQLHVQLQHDSQIRQTEQQDRINELEEQCVGLRGRINSAQHGQKDYIHLQDLVKRLHLVVESQKDQIAHLEKIASSRLEKLHLEINEKSAKMQIDKEKITESDAKYKGKIKTLTNEINALQSTLKDLRAGIETLQNQQRKSEAEKDQMHQMIRDYEVQIKCLQLDNKRFHEREKNIEIFRAKVLELQTDNNRMHDKMKTYFGNIPEDSG